MEAPNYIFVSGTTFYFLATLPNDDDFQHASVSACHREAFGHVDGMPCGHAPGASYAPMDVSGLYKKV